MPNVHILNVIAKAQRPPYRELVLNLFQTEEKVPFRFDEPCDVYALVGRYERHLRDNRSWLLKDVPRRRDLRVYEAVFTLYSFLSVFLQRHEAKCSRSFLPAMAELTS